MKSNRLDPSVIDRNSLEALVDALAQSGHFAIIDSQGRKTELPEPLYQHLIYVANTMRSGKAVVMMPEYENLTTQAAANFLGMSRQFFVNLLEGGEIPFHRVGKHRRVYFKDLVDYQNQRDTERSSVLDELSAAVEKAGFYYPEAMVNEDGKDDS